MCCQPQRASRNRRINTSLLPPGSFIAAAMHLAMMPATQRDDKFIADLASECPELGEAQMMRVRWAATADKAGLLGNIADMLAIADATRFG